MSRKVLDPAIGHHSLTLIIRTGCSFYHFSDGSLEAANNYCRNPAFSWDKKNPWCNVDNNGTISKEDCDIPYCSKYIEDAVSLTT